jgi:hypothetical protein
MTVMAIGIDEVESRRIWIIIQIALLDEEIKRVRKELNNIWL